MCDVNDVIQKVYETANDNIEDEFYSYVDYDSILPDIKAFIGDRKFKEMPGIKVYGEDETGISFIFGGWPKYLIVSLGEGEGVYEEFEPRLLKLMVPLKKSVKFDPKTTPKELLDLIPYVN